MTDGPEFISTAEKRRRNREKARHGAPPSNQFGVVIACAVVLFAVIGAIAAGCGGDKSAGPTTTAAAQAPEDATAESENETAGQKNARESAESYLENQAFSRSGLIKQLKYEGYSLADATYAVDAVTANWNEQAAKSAETYLVNQAFSRSGLIKQLKYEGYTPAQAAYAVNNITVNWNEQAAKSAKSYLENQSFSRSGLIQQLEYEGFTPAQARYGANAAY
jgi:Host cell surface-exposed lipoprotein